MRPLRPSWLHLGLPYPNRVPCLQGWTGGACALTHLLVGKPLVRLLWLPEAKTGPIPCRETSEPCVRGESGWTHLPPSTKRRVESHAMGASGSRRLPSSSLSHLLWPKVIRMQEHLLPRDLGGCGWCPVSTVIYVIVPKAGLKGESYSWGGQWEKRAG